MTQRLRDVALLGGAVAAVFVGALVRRLIDPRWEVMLGMAAIFAACAFVKWRWPMHAMLSRVSWRHLLLAFLILETALLLLADRSVVGPWWTVPAVICLGLLYCVIHLALGPRGDDGRRSSR